MVDGFTKWVNGLTAGAPKSREMRELVRRHDEWLRTAQLGVRYYAPDAYFEWQGPDHDPRLVLARSAIFDDRGRDRLYTPSGADSLNLFHQWEGITSTAPARPAHPRGVRIEGRLQDWANPELWTIKEGVA